MISNFLPFFHPYVSFFFFFFLLHFVHHIRIPLSISTSSHFSFSLLPLSRTSLILSSSFFPLLPLDSRSSPALSFFPHSNIFSWSFIVVLNFILFYFFCSWSAAVVVLILDLLFKLYQFYESKNFFAFIVVVWLILRLCFWVCILIMLEMGGVRGALCIGRAERWDEGREASGMRELEFLWVFS